MILKGLGLQIREVVTSTMSTKENDVLYRSRTAIIPYVLTAFMLFVGAPLTMAQTPGLVGAWGFNEDSGTTVTDSSGNNNTGTIIGATRTTAGKYGSALSFNGTNARVRVNSSASLNVTTGLTLEAWVRPTASQSAWRTIVQKQSDAYFLNASNDNGPLFPSGGGIFGGVTTYVSASAANPINVWTHVALTYDGAMLRLYVNGTQVASQARTGNIQITSNPLWIGGNNPYGEYFRGLIDEVRVYNRALTQAEIQADMNTPVGGGGGNTAPTITTITNQVTNEDAPTGGIGFTVGDAQTPAGSLIVSGSSSNTTLVPTGSITFGGSGANRTVTVTPAANQNGTANITVTVSDGSLSTPTSFQLTVNAVNDAPTIAAIANQSTSPGMAVGPLSFTIGDVETAAGSLTVSGSSNNTTLLPNANITFGGSGANRTVTVTPAASQTGTATITITVSDGVASTPTNFQVSVNAAPSGLVAAYNFNEGSGTTVADSSGNNNAGTISDATWTSAGKFGSALAFNGTNARVSISASPSLNVTTGITLEAWIMPTASQGGWRTIMQREVDAYFLNASNDNGPLLPSGGAVFNGQVDWLSGTVANPVNVWTHIALTHDGTMLRLYVNGVLAASKARTGAIQTNSNPLWIGGNSPYGEYFQGIIDEVRVYNRALSQAEIQTDMNTAVGSGPTRLVILQPTDGSTTTGASLAVNYTTSGDLTGVDHVHFRLDSGSEVMDGDFDGNYQFNDIPFGSHVLQGWLVRADHSKINGTDASVSFTTTPTGTDTTPPTVNITAPGSGSTVSATTSITADASDNIGVVGVQFFVDASPIGAEDTTAPYSINWDTTTIANGNHMLTARARDAAGSQAVSAPVSIAVVNGTSPNPADVGQWSSVANWPLVPVHATLLPTGDVLAWDGADQNGAAYIWHPNTNTFTNRNPPDNVFCAGHCLLPDGRILVVGGHIANFVGLRDANIFNASTLTWTQIPSMSYGRWYPTAITLPDGRVLVVAGDDGCVGCWVANPEIYNPATNTWVQLSNASNPLPEYPHLFVLSDGRVIATGTFEQAIATQTLNVGTQTWAVVDPAVVDGHSSVMYASDKFMKSGTSATSDAPFWPAENTTYVLDMTQAQPSWRETASMAYPRSYHNLTILPDGNILATGGNVTTDPYDQTQPVYAAEMWSPVSETWSTLASMSVPRFYHSIALLLPDARVLVAGGGRFGGGPGDDKLNAQIYSPPYLFKGTRPLISSAPNLISYNSNFTINTSSAASIAKAVLIPLGSVTHHFNANQRYLNLPFQVGSNSLNVQTPANSNLAQPGYYMLFIVDANGVPSVASIMRLQ
jgi:hypothetical protein